MRKLIAVVLVVALSSSAFARELHYPPEPTPTPSAGTSSGGNGINTGAVVAGSLAVTALIVYVVRAHHKKHQARPQIVYHLAEVPSHDQTR